MTTTGFVVGFVMIAFVAVCLRYMMTSPRCPHCRATLAPEGSVYWLCPVCRVTFPDEDV